MRHETKRIMLTAATLCAAGCAKSDFQVGRQNRANMRPMTNSVMANVPEEKPPKILPETHFAAGLLFERQGQFDRAIPQYRKAVALNHNYVVAFHRLGLLESATGQHLEAAQTLQKAVAMRPDNAVLRNDLGFEWMCVQQWDDAERELRRAIELQPDLATAHINLALVQAKSERFTESLASFLEVLPEPDAYYNLGLMYRGQQRYLEAMEAFRHVLTIAPEFSAAKIQIEQLSARTESPTPAEPVVEAAKFEPTPVDAPFIEEEEYAVNSEYVWGTTLVDLAAILAVLDADAHKDCDSPIDRPIVDDVVVEKTSDEDLAERLSDEEFVEEISLDSPSAAAAQLLADAPCEEEMMMPSIVVPTEDAVAVIEEFEGDESAAVEFIEEPLVVAGTMEIAGPPDPCDLEIEEVDADDVIAELTVDPITQPVGVRDSWAMLEELEAKIVMLRCETQAARIEKADFGDLAFRYDVLTTPLTWIEQGALTFDADSDRAAAEDDEFDDLDVPFVEIDEDDADEAEAPTPSDAIEEGPRKEPAPSERTSFWTTEFGELDTLLSIVRNESVCWDDLDAQTQDVLALGNADRPCVEGIERAALTESDEFSPAMPSDADDSMDVMENELTTSWESDRSGDAYTYPRGLETLPD